MGTPFLLDESFGRRFGTRFANRVVFIRASAINLIETAFRVTRTFGAALSAADSARLVTADFLHGIKDAVLAPTVASLALGTEILAHFLLPVRKTLAHTIENLEAEIMQLLDGLRGRLSAH